MLRELIYPDVPFVLEDLSLGMGTSVASALTAETVSKKIYEMYF